MTQRQPPPPRRSPWPRIGLRGNPFRAMSPCEVAEQVGAAPAYVRSCIGADEPVIEIVGHAGWGKSTLLEMMRRHGEGRGERWATSYVPPDADRPAEPAWSAAVSGADASTPRARGARPEGRGSEAACCWSIDEAQRIGPRPLARILSRCRAGEFRLALGTHTSLADACRRAGLACRSVALPPPDREMAAAFAAGRIAAAWIGAGAVPRLSPGAADHCVRLSAGNLHRVEELLYRAFQRFAEAGVIPSLIETDPIE